VAASIARSLSQIHRNIAARGPTGTGDYRRRRIYVSMSIIDMNTRRFERLERGQRETNDSLGRIEEALGRVADILEAHSTHFVRVEDALIGVSERVDRLTTAIARGRSHRIRVVRELTHNGVERAFRVLLCPTGGIDADDAIRDVPGWDD